MGGTIGCFEPTGRRLDVLVPGPVGAQHRRDRPRSCPPDQLRGVQVLVVDDIKINCDIMSRQLDAMGMVATCVEDGFAAMAELERAWHSGKPI